MNPLDVFVMGELMALRQAAGDNGKIKRKA